jgi:hypothetical protein
MLRGRVSACSSHEEISVSCQEHVLTARKVVSCSMSPTLRTNCIKRTHLIALDPVGTLLRPTLGVIRNA